MKLNDLIDIIWTQRLTVHDEATDKTEEYDNNGFGNGNTIKRVCHVYGNRTVSMIWPSDAGTCYISIA